MLISLKIKSGAWIKKPYLCKKEREACTSKRAGGHKAQVLIHHLLLSHLIILKGSYVSYPDLTYLYDNNIGYIYSQEYTKKYWSKYQISCTISLSVTV